MMSSLKTCRAQKSENNMWEVFGAWVGGLVFFSCLLLFLGGCYKWRLEAFLLKRLQVATCRGCDSWNLRITPTFPLVFGKAKGHSKLQLNYHRTGKGASRSEIYFFDTTSGCFLKAFSGWKELWWYFFTGLGVHSSRFCQMTSQEESSSFATSAWIPSSWKTKTRK